MLLETWQVNLRESNEELGHCQLSGQKAETLLGIQTFYYYKIINNRLFHLFLKLKNYP